MAVCGFLLEDGTPFLLEDGVTYLGLESDDCDAGEVFYGVDSRVGTRIGSRPGSTVHISNE